MVREGDTNLRGINKEEEGGEETEVHLSEGGRRSEESQQRKQRGGQGWQGGPVRARPPEKAERDVTGNIRAHETE